MKMQFTYLVCWLIFSPQVSSLNVMRSWYFRKFLPVSKIETDFLQTNFVVTESDGLVTFSSNILACVLAAFTNAMYFATYNG